MSTSAMVECEAEQFLEFADFEIDFIEEIRLRTWARQNYVPRSDRNDDWHPVILHEMRRIDQEG